MARCIARKEPVVRWASPGLHDLIALYRGPTFLILDICTFDHLCGHKGIREGNERTGGKERGGFAHPSTHAWSKRENKFTLPSALSSCAPRTASLTAVQTIPELTPVFPVKCLAWRWESLGTVGHDYTGLTQPPKAVSWVTSGLPRGVPTASSCVEC